MDKGIQKATAAIVLNSLGGGVVPRVGLEYITVGRRNEIGALLQDVELIQAGGSAIRFIEGRYGSGKTFLLYALKNHVLERNFVVSDVELSVDKRLVGNKGQGIAAYREMLRNLATRGCPDQGALKPVLDKWISELENEVEQESGLTPGHESFDIKVSQKVHKITSSLEEKVNGFDFATGDDFLEECGGDVEMARRLFHYVDWQHPSAAVPEIADEEEDLPEQADRESGSMRGEGRSDGEVPIL